MLIKKGSKGEIIRAIQRHLKLVVDGVFGRYTKLAVEKYQLMYGLTPDGIVGDETFSHMYPVNENLAYSDSLNISVLDGHVPDYVLNELAQQMYTGLDLSKVQLAHFLAQCEHESGHWRRKRENLNYSKRGLTRTFRKYFPNELLDMYARRPKRIANRVYADRMGNGSEMSGDGWRYRGRGYIQITGYRTYSELSDNLGIDLLSNPDLVATQYPLASALAYFKINNLWAICTTADNNTVRKLTRRINGGYNGLADRTELFHKYYWIL